MITRMVSKFHVEPREVNSAFSVAVFDGMLAKTDEEKLFFTTGDISRLSTYRTKLDNEIKQRKTGFLTLFINIYKQRLQQADSLIDVIGKTPFDFYTAEKLTAAEDTLYPASLAALRQKLYKKMKLTAIDDFTDDIPGNFKSFAPAKQKRYTDSVLTLLQGKTVSSLKRKISNILQSPYGIRQYVGNLYCEAIASSFDPHTEFFPPEEKENFESALGKQPFEFGFRLKADKNGGVLIDNLQPGSPAYKSGKLNKGDKFISLQREGQPTIDVSDITMRDFEALIDESNHQKVLFTVKKTGGTLVQVSLEKEQVADDDEDRVKSFILKGDNTIGYIYLPAFYQDWDTGNDGLNGCANDVGREILKLKKENITGLILDLRYNGGGSVQEATELAGIFVGAGPMGQEKEKGEKVRAIKNINGGTIFDGPMVVLVNGYSASAAEMVAGTLQDYNRAVIIGAPTYGKATMQVVLPIDTTITPANFLQTQTENYLKITIGKLYRVTGATAQFKGVQPDIVLPDILDAYITKEADEPFAMPPTTVPANKYYMPSLQLPIKALAQSVQSEIDTGRFFNAVKKFITYAKQQKEVKDIALNVKDALVANEQATIDADTTALSGTPSKRFIVKNNQYEIARIQADSNLKDMNEEFSKQLAADAYINIAYIVLGKLKNQ